MKKPNDVLNVLQLETQYMEFRRRRSSNNRDSLVFLPILICLEIVDKDDRSLSITSSYISEVQLIRINEVLLYI